MMHPQEKYLETVASYLHCRQARYPVISELRGHLMDRKEALLSQGLSESEAEAQAVKTMGDPAELGKALDQLHRPFWYQVVTVCNWILALLIVVMVLAIPWRWVQLPNLLLPPGAVDVLMETDESEVLWEGVCREKQILGDYTFSIPAVALIRSQYAPDGTEQPTCCLRLVLRSDHWKAWIPSPALRFDAALESPAGTLQDELWYDPYGDSESLCSAVCQIQLEAEEDADWFILTLEHGEHVLNFPISRKEAES